VLVAVLVAASAPAGAQDLPGPDQQPNIVGGTTAANGQFPWMGALIRRGQSRSEGFFCGVSVLSRSWALTAGHCVLDYNDSYPDGRYGPYVAASYFDVKEATRAVLAVVRERDGRDAERWRHWRLHAHEFGVMLPFAGPADMDSAIDAAIDAAMKEGR